MKTLLTSVKERNSGTMAVQLGRDMGNYLCTDVRGRSLEVGAEGQTLLVRLEGE